MRPACLRWCKRPLRLAIVGLPRNGTHDLPLVENVEPEPRSLSMRVVCSDTPSLDAQG